MLYKNTIEDKTFELLERLMRDAKFNGFHLAGGTALASLSEMLNAYETKYQSNYIPALKSLLYFDDIDFNEPVQMTNGKFKWKQISKRLEMMSKYPKRVFSNPV